MARTIPSAAATEAAKVTGARPIYILQVDLPSGTVYWSGEYMTSPVTTQARVLSWGDLSLDASPGRGGSVADLKITVQDSDGAVRAAAASQPGFQHVDATLYLFFEGTTWSTDKIILHKGVLTTPADWDEATCTYTLTMRGLGHKYDQNLGTVMSRRQFSEIDCKACDNELLPIVYGNPCRRVPCCVINRPGVAQLAAELTSLPPSSSLTIDQGAAAAAFTYGSSINLVVGWPSRWEKITGSFSGSGSTSFSITGRGSILAAGTVGYYGIGGNYYITIPKADLPDSGAANRGGCPLLLQKNDSSWMGVMVTHWWLTGNSVVVCVKGSDMSVNINNAYKLLREPGVVPHWPVGTPVNEAGTWTYIVNCLPSKSIDRVEMRARVNVTGGDSHVKWATINPAYYSVNLNNKTYNAKLGRHPTNDPGITTVALDFSPAQLGMDGETIYVTLKGITDDNTTSGSVLEDPTDVIKNMLTNRWIGNLPSGAVNSGMFSAAATDVVTKAAFAILNEKQKLVDVCADIAHQANCLFFWDAGQACIKYVGGAISSGDSIYTVTDSNRKRLSLRISEVDAKEYITEMTGKFRRTIVDDDQRIVRDSRADTNTSHDASSAGGNAAITDFGIQREEIDFWAYQLPSSVAKATELWLKHYLRTNRIVTVGLYFDAIKLQPGDTITLNLSDGAGNTIINSPARIRTVRTTLGNSRNGQMPGIEVTCEVNLYHYDIMVYVPSDTDCAGQNTSGGRARSQVLAVKSSGGAGGLHVVDNAAPSFGLAADGATLGDDPSANQSTGANNPYFPPAVQNVVHSGGVSSH